MNSLPFVQFAFNLGLDLGLQLRYFHLMVEEFGSQAEALVHADGFQDRPVGPQF